VVRDCPIAESGALRSRGLERIQSASCMHARSGERGRLGLAAVASQDGSGVLFATVAEPQQFSTGLDGSLGHGQFTGLLVRDGGGEQESAVRRIVLAIAAVSTVMLLSGSASNAVADEAPVVYHSRAVRHVCHGPRCGPYTACGPRCRHLCPGGYWCRPLYGAYGPYGGVGYWGGYTFTGWGQRW
jgi:hypothetical protein